VIGLLLFIATVAFLSMHPTGKEIWQRVSLKIPVIGGIIEYAILERFCSVLATMLQAGVAVPSAMQTTTEAVSNVVYKEQLDIARQQMLEGSGFTQPLIETELFPGAARQMFKVGEDTGTLDEQLAVAAEYFNRELEFRIQRFTTMFEPIMIIFVGLIVGFVAIALVSAMYGVLNGVQEDV
jgi:type IV pilus assembly protein PilC